MLMLGIRVDTCKLWNRFHRSTAPVINISWLFQLWRWEGDDPKRQLVTGTHILPEWAETVTTVRKCGNVMQPVSLYQQATQIRHTPLSAAQASPAHRDRVVFWRSDFVLKHPETAYAWPMHGLCILMRFFYTKSWLHRNARKRKPRRPTPAASGPASATNSKFDWFKICSSILSILCHIFKYLLSNLQFCDHPSVLPRHVLGSNCGIPTTRLTSCSSCTDGNN